MANIMRSFSKYLLRWEDAGGEYFTVKKTGKSGMSQSGVARFVGKHPTSIGDWVDKVRKADPMGNSLPEPLKPFAGKDLKLEGYTDPQGRDILEDRFCAALVTYYALYAKDKETNIQARQTHKLIGELGMRKLIHQKTGWHPARVSAEEREVEQVYECFKERVKARTILKDELRPELMSAVKEWQVKHGGSRRIYSQTHDTMNECIQGVKSRQIKENNNLPKNALIRDYYDTRPLIDYAAISRFAANLIRSVNLHPVEAVKLACAFYYPPEHSPTPVQLIENIHKVGKLLEAKRKAEELKAANLKAITQSPD